MAAAQESTGLPKMSPEAMSLAFEWRRFARIATGVALLTAPAFFIVLLNDGLSVPLAALVTFLAVIAFRGTVDLVVHRLIPRPSLFGASGELLEEDIVARRRRWYWRTKWKQFAWLAVIAFALLGLFNLALRIFFGIHAPLFSTFTAAQPLLQQNGPIFLSLIFQLPLLFLVNALIFIGPLMLMGIKQIKAYEPGDANWGVKLSDVRGQSEPKEEVTRVISLWQSGEDFKKAGGKPERGLLFLGAPGTGKTMLSKAIATNFNCPFVTMPGSGFAQTFIGVNVMVVMFLMARARKLARKWGGQCIIFIDEIDAVGQRRAALGAGQQGNASPAGAPAQPFHGEWGALTGTGDVVIETREWRERLFADRAEPPRSIYPPFVSRARERISGVMFPGGMGMGMGGGMALNQLLVQMDGMDEPPLLKRMFTRRLNTFLDATYLVPQRLGALKLRLPAPPPRTEQVYFIGATNAPIDSLDPALIRPGRMGRHIWFRTPTKDDRKDIFELYLKKVSHLPDMDTDHRRDELARMTNGYSPAMIEQVCSMALTLAHSEGKPAFGREEVVEAMTTIETGTARSIEYVPAESRATALHEAGHAAASFLYQDNIEATRLTIKMRGNALGHFQAMQKEERFSRFRSEQMALLIMVLGAMATEVVFYEENANGVGGDIGSVSELACRMVGLSAMGPIRVELDGRFGSEEEEEAGRERIMARFERIGNQLIQRGGSGQSQASDSAYITGVLNDRFKRTMAAQLLGQAFVTAYNAAQHNRAALERIADELVARRELHGDEVVELLERSGLQRPQIDVLDPACWPKM